MQDRTFNTGFSADAASGVVLAHSGSTRIAALQAAGRTLRVRSRTCMRPVVHLPVCADPTRRIAYDYTAATVALFDEAFDAGLPVVLECRAEWRRVVDLTAPGSCLFDLDYLNHCRPTR